MSRSSAGASRGSSRRSSRRATRRSATSTVRRRASVGCAVRTGWTRTRASASLGARPAKRGPQPSGLGGTRGRARSSGRAPNAVARLGQVDQLEVQPERADDALERLGIDRQDVERDPLVCPAPARRDRAQARRLDELEDLGARPAPR